MIIRVQNYGFAPKPLMKNYFGFEWSGEWEISDEETWKIFDLSHYFDVFIRERDGQYTVFLDKKNGSFKAR